MKNNKLAVKISNRIKRWLKPLILSENQWIRPIYEQIDEFKTLNPEYFEWLMKHKLIDSFEMIMSPQYPDSKNILFSVVIPVYNTPPQLLEKAINSVFRQVYTVWEIIMCDDASDSEATLNFLNTIKNRTNKNNINNNHVKILTNSTNKGISESTNYCVENAKGDYVVFLDHDDELYPDALLKTKEAIDKHPEAGVFYSDEDYISKDGYHNSYNYKPDFSPSLLENHNYILHMVCVKKEIFIKSGGLKQEFDGSQDYDFLLRLMDIGETFIHIQDILYSWRENETSMIGGMLKPSIFTLGRKALEEHYKRAKDNIEYIKDSLGNIRGIYRTRFVMPEKISILVVQIGRQNLKFNLYEIPENISIEHIIWDTSQHFPIEIADTKSDAVIFLDSLLIPTLWHEFINEIIPLVFRKNIGAAGALVYSKDDKIIGAGRSLMPWGDMRNDFFGYNAGDKNSSAQLTRDVIAVSGAAMALSSEVLRKVLDQGELDQTMWDVEICFRLQNLAFRVIFTPNASALYSGNIKDYKGSLMFCVSHVAKKYNIVKDPYLNLNLIDQENRTFSSKKLELPSLFRKKESINSFAEQENDHDKDEFERKNNDFYYKWLALHSPDLKKSYERISKLKIKPFFSIILPTYNSPLLFFKELLNAFTSQTYTNFEICISDDASTDTLFLEFLNLMINNSSQEFNNLNINVIRSEKNSGIAENTNRAISIAKGDWFVLCDHDDLIEPFALEMIAQYINDNPKADILYSDEDMIDQKGWRHSPRLQPDWNPDMFLSHMYCPHIVSFKRTLLDKILICSHNQEQKDAYKIDNYKDNELIKTTPRPFNPDMDGAQDYDFFLRMTEKAGHIGHIPMILYSWRAAHGSVAYDACAKLYAYDAGKKALEAAVKRRGENAIVLKAGGTKLGVYRVKRKISRPCLCSHIIEAGSEFVYSMVDNIRNISSIPVEIILVCKYKDEDYLKHINNISGVNVVMVDNNASKSESYNAGASAAKGEHLIFSSRFIDLLDSDYPFGLVEHTQRDEIGAVGVKIIYPNGFFYHTGIILGVNGVAGYAHRNIEQNPGYWHFASCIRNYSSVSWDFIGVSKKKFNAVQGFDTSLNKFGDVDFCLKLLEKGYNNLYTPYVSAVINRQVHFLEELRDAKEEKIITERYKALINNDPMHHPLMSKNLEDFSIGI